MSWIFVGTTVISAAIKGYATYSGNKAKKKALNAAMTQAQRDKAEAVEVQIDQTNRAVDLGVPLRAATRLGLAEAQRLMFGGDIQEILGLNKNVGDLSRDEQLELAQIRQIDFSDAGVGAGLFSLGGPIFRFRQDQLNKQINRAASARGLFGSGASLKTLADASIDLTGREAEAQFNRAITLAQQGQDNVQFSAGLIHEGGVNVANTILQSGKQFQSNILAQGQRRAQTAQAYGQIGSSLVSSLGGQFGGISPLNFAAQNRTQQFGNFANAPTTNSRGGTNAPLLLQG